MTIYSHSRLKVFEQCPLKFKFKYLDKIKPDIKDFIEGFLGNKVHETLEWIYNHPNKKYLKLDEVIQNFIENWNREFTNKIKIVKSEYNYDYYFNNGIKFLINYFLKHSPFEDNTIATEKKIFVDLDSGKKYKIQGYIDRLVHHKNTNVFEIHDYKTTNFLKTQEELDKDRQLALYSIGIKDLFNSQEVYLIWHFLAFNKKMISKRTSEQLENLKQETITLIKKIESTKDFPAQQSKLCKWCEFQNSCTINENNNF